MEGEGTKAQTKKTNRKQDLGFPEMKRRAAKKEAEAQTEGEDLALAQLIKRSKVEHLLSELKYSVNRHHNLQMEEMLKKEIADLKMQVVRERMKNKKIKLFSLFKFILLLVVLLFLLIVLLLLAFAS